MDDPTTDIVAPVFTESGQGPYWDSEKITAQVESTPFRVDGTVAPSVGQRIGRYEVLGRVGAGGMGQVYRAHDPELQRIVAIKVHNLHPGENSSLAQLRSRLMTEGRALACISDPHVVTVYDVGLFRGQVFVAMELIPGCNLAEWIRSKPRSPRRIVEAYLGAAAGLAAVHRVGVIHRDVKPANFVIGTDRRVRTVDLGLACAHPSQATSAEGLSPTGLTQNGFIMGTPAYIAPEQLAGRELDDRCDQFSFCVALWEALAGELPFAGSSMEQRADAIARGALRGRRKVPRAYRSILERGLHANPDRRHDSMVDVAQKLRTAMERPTHLAVGVAKLLAVVVACLGIWAMTRPQAVAHRQASSDELPAEVPSNDMATARAPLPNFVVADWVLALETSE